MSVSNTSNKRNLNARNFFLAFKFMARLGFDPRSLGTICSYNSTVPSALPLDYRADT